MFYSPIETFREIALKPDLLVPILTMVIAGVLSAILIVPHIDFAGEFQAQAERTGRSMSPSQIAVATSFSKGTVYVSPVILIVMLAIYAGIVMLIFKAFGWNAGFLSAFAISIYSSFPRMLEGLINCIIIIGRGKVLMHEMPAIFPSSPAFFIDPVAHPVLYALGAQFDVFALWGMALTIIGFAFMGGISRARSAAVVVPLWLVGVFFSVGMAALQNMGSKAAGG